MVFIFGLIMVLSFYITIYSFDFDQTWSNHPIWSGFQNYGLNTCSQFLLNPTHFLSRVVPLVSKTPSRIGHLIPFDKNSSQTLGVCAPIILGTYVIANDVIA